MSKKLILSAILALSSLLINADVLAVSLVGEWKGSLNTRTRIWYENGTLKTDEQKTYGIDFMFYPNGEYANLLQSIYEHGLWRKSGARFSLLPDFSGPPSIINGSNNSIDVTVWKVSGKKKGNKISGKYLMRYTITVWDYFSGVIVVNYAEIAGNFTARRIPTTKQADNFLDLKTSTFKPLTIEGESKQQMVGNALKVF